jgi:lipopolysaccharide/colanic/teichoic acid biosynthesis glycosyltransferase
MDVMLSSMLLLVLLPAFAGIALAIKVDSPGPVFFKCRRVGYRGRDLQMLKFRKMHVDAAGPALTVEDDERFTRVGRKLAHWKLDEIPQLWNVLRGQMSLVGPRPEDPVFVNLHREAYERILGVRPGVTGLSQLAFAEEGQILRPDDTVGHYLERLLPQKVGLDLVYVSRCSLALDARILGWTTVAVVFRRPVAVHRHTGRLGLRRRPER